MRKRLVSLSVMLGLSIMLGAASAFADQITLGPSATDGSTGLITIGCGYNATLLQEACSVGLTGPITSSSFTGFGSSSGTYTLSGGPTVLTSSDGGSTFSVAPNPPTQPWGFVFDDAAGDHLEGSANWNSFQNAGSTAFQTGVLQITINTISGSAQFVNDFGSGAYIDLVLITSPDVGTLYSNAAVCLANQNIEASCGQTSETGVSIENGSVLPAPVPEPGTLALFGSGLFGIASFMRRKITRS